MKFLSYFAKGSTSIFCSPLGRVQNINVKIPAKIKVTIPIPLATTPNFRENIFVIMTNNQTIIKIIVPAPGTIVLKKLYQSFYDNENFFSIIYEYFINGLIKLN